MASVQQTVLLEYPSETMFDLVDRIEDYPKFLPWCGAAKILKRAGPVTVATLQIDYHGLKQSFTTENTAQDKSAITIRLLDGPFSRLDGSWRFSPLGASACKIEFMLHYDFSSRLLEMLVGPVFNRIAKTLVDAFIKRAAATVQRGG